jgi:hypothetical protein
MLAGLPPAQRARAREVYREKQLQRVVAEQNYRTEKPTGKAAQRRLRQMERAKK